MFQKAERKKAKLRAAICGTSGSGKTYSALLLARGLVGETGKIAVIDTERGSASLYADVTDFDVAELEPPYSPARYRALIVAAAKQYDALIIDSITHEWTGEGGILELHDKATAVEPGRNSYTAWKNITPQHQALVDTILAAPCHIIATMRTKSAYEIQTNDRGKKAPVKIGMAPIQKEGMEYEFTLVLDVSVEGNVATAAKDRTRIWHQRNEVITTAHGRELRQWLDSGAAAELPTDPAPVKPAAIPPALLAKLAACKTVDECRLWIPATRIALNLSGPQDPLYQTVIAAGKARAEELNPAPVDPLTAVPEPATAAEPQPEPTEDLEPIE